MSIPRHNLELKARCQDLEAARAAACHLGARADGEQRQIDTYFRAPHRRLKLREIEGRSAELISYDRPNQNTARQSAYYLVPVPDAALLKAALATALGVRGEVRKHRAVYLWHNVRIHLDEVASLGSFVEFEAVLSAEAGEELSRQRLEELGRALGLDPSAHLAPSYADLLGL